MTFPFIFHPERNISSRLWRELVRGELDYYDRLVDNLSFHVWHRDEYNAAYASEEWNNP